MILKYLYSKLGISVPTPAIFNPPEIPPQILDHSSVPDPQRIS